MKVRGVTSALCAAVLVAGAAAAQDPKPGEKPMSAEQKAMMEAWARVATPGEPHKALAGMVGTWDAEVTSYMDPGQPPTKSKGTSENRLVLGGRWVESRFKSEMMGQPFEGIGYTGYDNYKKKYIGTWTDTMSTSLMTSEGTMDAAGKVMTSTSTMANPVTGKSETTKMTTTIVSPDHHVFEMWGPGPDGKVVKQMQIDYRRKK